MKKKVLLGLTLVLFVAVGIASGNMMTNGDFASLAKDSVKAGEPDALPGVIPSASSTTIINTTDVEANAPTGTIPQEVLDGLDDSEYDGIVDGADGVVPAGVEDASVIAVSSGQTVTDGMDIPMKKFTLKVGNGQKVFNVADVNDVSHIYGECVNKKNTWIVISKKEFRVYVYEAVAKDTLLRATFPVCYARNAPDKTRTGDSCTPESRDEKTPFTISQIQDASSWRHTFANDPRGNILAYGPYFMRLQLTGSKVPGNRSIGIHGCGGHEGKSNSYSVPGRDSEGCLRLRDADLRMLRTKYCEVGTRVFIKPATGARGNRFGYEKCAIKACKGFVPATLGNPLSGKTKTL